MRFEVLVWVSFSLRRKKGHVSAYLSGEQSARRPPRRSAARRDRRLDKKTAPVSVLRRQHFPLLRIARRRIPTHRPARSGHSRGPGRRERACRSRRSQHAGARLHLWCGKGGRGEKGERRRKVKVKVERGEEAPFFFFLLDLATPTSAFDLPFVVRLQSPRTKEPHENRRCIRSVTKSKSALIV